MARQLIDLQIDTDRAPHPERNGVYSVRALANDIEASIRSAAVEKSIVNRVEIGESSTDWVDAIERHRKREADTSAMFLEYRNESVRVARSLNDMLNQLGVKRVSVRPAQKQ
jgi:hypothetical protein